MVTSKATKLLHIAFLLSAISAFADEPQLPAVQIEGNFLPFAAAVRIRGGKVRINAAGDYIVEKNVAVFNVSEGEASLSAVRSAFFPETVLVDFAFKDVLRSSEGYINGRGPISSIKIGKDGNGNGSVYLESSADNQDLELRKSKKSSKTKFSVGKSQQVECKGKEKLSCSNP